MNLYDRVLSSGRVMTAPLVGYPGIKLIGSSVRDALVDAEVQLEALKALEKRLKQDIVFTFLDLTVEVEALGLGVDYFDKKPPSLAECDPADVDSLAQLDVPDPEQAARMPHFLRVAEGLAEDGERMCGAFVTGPFTLLALLIGTEELLDRVRAEESLDDPMGFAMSVVGEYAAALASRVDMVVVVDPAAEALRPSEFGSICRPYLSGLAGIIRASGGECLLHICGDVSHLLEEMSLAGVGGIFLDSQVNLPREAEKLPSNLVLLGNIDPKRIIQRGTAEDVHWEVRRLLRNMKEIRNFVLSTGCDVPVDVPMKNLEAMMEEARNWIPRSGLF